MAQQVKDGNLISVLDQEPFSDVCIEPTAYVFSDGGHGGCAEITFCPFCGKKMVVHTNREED
jgi:hypothetical protein